MTRAAVIFAIFSVTWILWSGHFDPTLLTFGLLSVLITMWISYRMDAVAGYPRTYRLGFRPLRYAPWLLWEVIKSNLNVARIIVDPRLPLSPRLIKVSTSQDTDLAQVIYANSITLTPGTITLDIRDHTIIVHALTEESAAILKTGEMDRRVAELEGPA